MVPRRPPLALRPSRHHYLALRQSRPRYLEECLSRQP
jgi:hypothetical protein